jgi:hypothetical protein
MILGHFRTKVSKPYLKNNWSKKDWDHGSSGTVPTRPSTHKALHSNPSIAKIATTKNNIAHLIILKQIRLWKPYEQNSKLPTNEQRTNWFYLSQEHHEMM